MSSQVLQPDVIATIFSANYGLGQPTHCELIRAGFNHNYRIETANGQYVMRVYLNGKYYIQDADDFRFELALLNFLLARNLQVACPIANNQGEWLTAYEIDRDIRYTVLFEFIPGVAFDHADLSDDDIREAGRIAARMHLAMNEFSSPHHRYHLDLTYLLDAPLRLLDHHLAERQLGDVDFFAPFAAELRRQVAELPRTANTYGLIHADLHGTNIFLDPDAGLTVFDFDHCAYGWRAYEFVPWTGNPAVLALMVEGYETVRPLSIPEQQAIPLFTTLREIWGIGDILAFQPLWGEQPSDDYLQRCIQTLHEIGRKT